ncbi:lipocalin [Sulfitobacter sp. S190]|uniref:lipocalin n=1 Tax=Sulfitobacter sp. S190 TaxID=2867022 RepID=UPI0021A35E27|nr:lipocalin [Sulfitobacter sp. S190]UWR23494.1 lipocalin [Sulfitobacter sp. S190]
MRKAPVHRTYTGRAQSVCRRSAAWAALAVALAGCAAAPVPQGDVRIGLRNPTAPLGGVSRFEVARFAGDWTTLRCLGDCAARVRYVVATDGVLLREADGVRTPYRISAPGVLREVGGDATLVVMWVDEGFRTAAVGDAEGTWAAVIDRGTGSADRTAAATEILDFNGWDVSRIRSVE